MAITYIMKDEDPSKIIKKERKGNKIAKNIDPGNYYRRKAKMDAQNDMSAEPYDPKEGKKRGKKLLDKLINLEEV